MSFKKISEDNIKNKNIVMYQHKTGINLIHVKEKPSDKNYVFSAIYKTNSENNKGTAHILEHCLLSGSKKYPVKDPFNEFMKGSTYTYLNALTYPDKTMYPLSSYVYKDFLNLVDGYLDGLFCPNFENREELILKEGWHFDVVNEKLKYSGIVLNEMVENYSDPYEQLRYMSYEHIFKGENLQYNSAGKPEDIITLTCNDIKNYYDKYYCGDNCYLYVYGDMDIKDVFSLVEEKLSFVQDKKENFSVNKAFNNYKKEINKDLIMSSKNVDVGYKYICICYNIGKYNLSNNYTFSVLVQYLQLDDSYLMLILNKNHNINNIEIDFENSLENPLLRFIVKAKDGEISEIELTDYIKKSVKMFIIEVKNNSEKIQNIVNAIKLEQLELKHPYRPKGLIYCFNLMDSWIYNNKPLDYFKFENNSLNLDNIKDIFKNEYKLILVNDKIKGYKTYDFNINNVNNTTENMEVFKYQKKQLEKLDINDKLEDIEKIPRISLSDININDFKKFNHYESDTNGINYLNLYFSTNMIKHEDLHYIYLICNCISNDYKKYVNIDFNIVKNKENGDSFSGFIVVKYKGFSGDIQELINVIDIDDKEKIYNTIMCNMEKNKEESNKNSGKLACELASSLVDCSKYYNINATGYYEYFNNDKTININMEKLKEIYNFIFKNPEIIYYGNQKELKDIELTLKKKYYSNEKYEHIKPLVNNKKKVLFHKNNNNLASVAYSFRYSLPKHKHSIYPLFNILENQIFLEEIRGKGGAYETSIIFDGNVVTFYSNSDSNINNTLHVFKTAFERVKEYILSDYFTNAEMDRNIIGALNKIVKPKHVSQYLFLQGINNLHDKLYNSNSEKIYKELLKGIYNTNKEELLYVIDNISIVDVGIGVVGNRDLIENSQLYKSTLH